MDEKIPQSIGVIMDGNRRWAKIRNQDPWEGHRVGAAALKNMIALAKESGVKHFIFYTLSTENWNRTPKEISFLLVLLKEFFLKNIQEMAGQGVRIRIVGQRDRFPVDIQTVFAEAEEQTKHNDTYVVWFALSYGGRAEIVDAAKRAAGMGEITEETISENLWTVGMPDPDLIIRTGGEKRLSNFLTWQSTYSELFFSDTMWPDFSKEEFHAILKEYGERERRRGK